MTTKNTGSFTQFPRVAQVNITTANGGSLTAPTQTGLAYVAGPDGSDVWMAAAVATAAQTSANTIQLYVSKDFGATFGLLPITGTFAAGGAVSTVLNLPLPNTIPSGPTSPLVLGGVPGAFTHTMAQSSLSENAAWFVGQFPTAGTANVQTLAQCYNSAQTAYGAAQVTGRIIDFVAGLTNSGAMTLTVGTAAAAAVTTPAGAALTGNEVTKGFRYRVIDAGTSYILLPTDRLYCAMTQSQAVTVTINGADR